MLNWFPLLGKTCSQLTFQQETFQQCSTLIQQWDIIQSTQTAAKQSERKVDLQQQPGFLCNSVVWFNKLFIYFANQLINHPTFFETAAVKLHLAPIRMCVVTMCDEPYQVQRSTLKSRVILLLKIRNLLLWLHFGLEWSPLSVIYLYRTSLCELVFPGS